MNQQSESSLLKEAKECAEFEAEYFVKNLVEVANKYQFDVEWFVAEALNQAHNFKRTFGRRDVVNIRGERET